MFHLPLPKCNENLGVYMNLSETKKTTETQIYHSELIQFKKKNNC
jgi:hypothetical protein